MSICFMELDDLEPGLLPAPFFRHQLNAGADAANDAFQNAARALDALRLYQKHLRASRATAQLAHDAGTLDCERVLAAFDRCLADLEHGLEQASAFRRLCESTYDGDAILIREALRAPDANEAVEGGE